MGRIAAFLGVARVPFLALPVVLVALGTAAAVADGAPLRWGRALLALVGLVALHVAVNVLNEVSDARTGIDDLTRPTPFSGGSKTIPGGRLSPRAALLFGLAMIAAGCGVGGWFLVTIGWPLLPFLAVGAVLVLGYTDVLARVGLGEVGAGLGLGALPVLGSALVQDGWIGPAAIAAAAPSFFLTFDLLLLNEFPDIEADRSGGRRNLVLALGPALAAMVWAVAALLVPATILVAVVLGLFPAWALLGLLPSLLLARPLAWAIRGAPGEIPVPALAANVAWNLATHALLALGLVLPAILP